MITENLQSISQKLPPEVKLVAVSKFHSVDRIREAYAAGQRIFAESRPQELAAKVPLLPSDIQWHFIGHLQTNKLKLVLPYVSLVQSVDSLHLLQAISSWAEANHRTVNVLLELHLGAEETKQGFTESEILDLLARCAGVRSETLGPTGLVPPIASDGPLPLMMPWAAQVSERTPAQLKNVRIFGLMGMATNTDDRTVVERDFARIEALFKRIRAEHPQLRETFTELSIGMSGDWPLALRHGATMVRIGTDIFGPREY